MGELAYSGRGAIVRIAGNGRLGKYRNGAALCSPGTESFNGAREAN